MGVKERKIDGLTFEERDKAGVPTVALGTDRKIRRLKRKSL